MSVTRTITGTISGGGAERKMKAEDGKPFTPTEQRKKQELMRQFLQLDGPKGNSEAYQEGWERVFGTPRCEACAETIEKCVCAR